MSDQELQRLWHLIDKRGDYSSNLSKREQEEYEELCEQYRREEREV